MSVLWEEVGRFDSRERNMGLPSKQNTVYKLIRLLELIPDGGEIAWERDTCQQWRSQGWDTKPRLELRSGKKLIRSGRHWHGTWSNRRRWGQRTRSGKRPEPSLCQGHGHTISSLLHLLFVATWYRCRQQLSLRTRGNAVQWDFPLSELRSTESNHHTRIYFVNLLNLNYTYFIFLRIL